MSHINATYHDLSSYCDSPLVKHLGIKVTTLRVYRSRFSTYISNLGFKQSDIIDISIFQIRDKKLLPQNTSVVIYMYKVLMVMLANTINMDKFNLLDLCFQVRIPQKSSKSLEEKFNNWSLEDFIKAITRNSTNELSEIEDLFLLPNGVLLKEKRHIKSSSIPQDWWPDDFIGKKNAADRTLVRKYIFAGQNIGEEVSHEKFLQVVDFIRNDGHLTEHTRNINAYREDHPRIKVEMLGNLSVELNDLILYKTTSNITDNDAKKLWVEETASINASFIKGFLSHIATCFADDVPNPDRDWHDRLSIAYIIHPEYVISLIEDAKAAAKEYNQGSEKTIKTVKAMLMPEVGWIWMRPNLISKLPDHIQKIIISNGGWYKYCEISRTKLTKYMNSKIRPYMSQSINSKEKVIDILQDKKPLEYIFNALEYCRKDLLARKNDSPSFARDFQDYILMFLIANFPLRAKNWSLMLYNSVMPNNSHLRLSPQKQWQIVIPVSELKNASTSKMLRKVHEVRFPIGKIKPMHEHLKMLDLFISKYRLIINKSQFLFVNTKGEQMTPSIISDAILRWSEEFLSKFSPHPIRMVGVEPFMAHVVRSLVATHYVKKGDKATARFLLLDSDETIQKHYVKDNVDQQLDRICDDMTDSDLGIGE